MSITANVGTSAVAVISTITISYRFRNDCGSSNRFGRTPVPTRKRSTRGLLGRIILL
jgi:hypothetical protein